MAIGATGKGPRGLEDQRKRPERWLGKNADGVLYHQGLLYVPEIFRTELISRHHDDLLAGHFGIDETRELITRKYFWPTPHCDVEAYVTGCDNCLASKAVRHKHYSDLQLLPVPTQ